MTPARAMMMLGVSLVVVLCASLTMLMTAFASYPGAWKESVVVGEFVVILCSSYNIWRSAKHLRGFAAAHRSEGTAHP